VHRETLTESYELDGGGSKGAAAVSRQSGPIKNFEAVELMPGKRAVGDSSATVYEELVHMVWYSYIGARTVLHLLFRSCT
jgi:hypothetical protein